MTQPGRGGYRRPRNPAPVSPPGRMSRRTDGGPAQRMQDLPNPAYGEQQTFRDVQAGAPMAAAEGVPEGAASSPVDLSGVVGLDSPSERPDEPITSGAPAGDGPGLEALGGLARDKDLATMRAYLPGLELMANMSGAPPALRDFVRELRAYA